MDGLVRGIQKIDIPGQLRKPGRELVLKTRIRDVFGRSLRSAAMPISAADRRRRIVAHRKPRLREMPLFQIVRRTRTTRFRPNPAGSTALLSTRATVARSR